MQHGIDAVTANVNRINPLVADMKLETPPAWALATDATFVVLDGATTVNAARINAVTNWATSLTAPNFRTAFAIIRIPEDAHIGDYRITANHQNILLNGLIRLTQTCLLYTSPSPRDS